VSPRHRRDSYEKTQIMRHPKNLLPSSSEQVKQADKVLKAAAELLEQRRRFTDQPNYMRIRGLLTRWVNRSTPAWADRHLTIVVSTKRERLPAWHREEECDPSITTVSALPRQGTRDSENRQGWVVQPYRNQMILEFLHSRSPRRGPTLHGVRMHT
jgi:hypothetical protein